MVVDCLCVAKSTVMVVGKDVRSQAVEPNMLRDLCGVPGHSLALPREVVVDGRVNDHCHQSHAPPKQLVAPPVG